HITGGGARVANDTRILNFRVLRLGWSSILPTFTSHIREQNYNSWGFEVTAPKDGWISVNQIHDPLWKVTIDGQPAPLAREDAVRSAFPITGGSHQIQLEYWPFARRLYWLACSALEVLLLFLGGVALQR